MLNTLIAYPLFLPSVGPMEVAVLLTVVLILFGPGKLPEVFKALGTGVRQFKEASKGLSGESPTPSGSSQDTPAS